MLLLCVALPSAAQNAFVEGLVKDSTGRPIPNVNVIVIDRGITAITDDDGTFEFKIPAGEEFEVALSYIGRPARKVPVRALEPGERFQLNVQMQYGVSLAEVVVSGEHERRVSIQLIDPRAAQTLPNPSGSFETILKTMPGVSSNNELSAQYNVRGGNYDENLIYVNDIEIYRPFLPRSGQQEGLSFIHTEMVQNVKFSAGGFEARYGDKMSSVLDIKYRDPKGFASTVNASLLGVQAHTEGVAGKGRFTYLLGARYWSNQYVLSTLDVQGDYKPAFADVQTLLTWHIRSNLSLSFLGGYAQNKYLVVPQTRETVFGTVKTALKLRIFFDGQDLMEYRTATGAMSLNWQPDHRTQFKFYASAFSSNEDELFTIEGAYRLEEVETDFGSKNFGQSKADKGIGYFLNNARNRIDARVYNAGVRGYHSTGNHSLQWGAQVQAEEINDRMNEWYFTDSLGYAQPSLVNGQIVMREWIHSKNDLSSYRISGYVQNAQTLSKPNNLIFSYGVRNNWWSLNDEHVFSPRAQISIEPNRAHNRAILFDGEKGTVRKDIVLKAAFGYYYQPPFYRELRRYQGDLNTSIKAQRAIHYVLGGDMNIKMWDRPFKLFAEAYYKDLDNLIPYEIDNVRIRYFADNTSEGYATGLDFRLNGEFVKGTESWASLSIMQTQERTKGATGAAGAYIPRPTDQRFNASIMFQDYLPKFPNYRMYLNLVYGSGLPFGVPDHSRIGDTLRMPSYRRVDIGFLKVIVDENKPVKKGWKQYTRSMLLGVEVFNLLAVDNTISYLWIQDIEGRTWAVPNYLTGRRVNVRLMIKI
jgi:hypothetical protein